VKLLIASGASVNVRNKHGNNAFHRVMSANVFDENNVVIAERLASQKAIVEILLEKKVLTLRLDG